MNYTSKPARLEQTSGTSPTAALNNNSDFIQARNLSGVSEHESPIGSREAGQFLRKNHKTIERLARSGDIPGYKLGKTWLFLKSELLAFLTSRLSSQQAIHAAKWRTS